MRWDVLLVLALCAAPGIARAQSGTPDEDLGVVRELVLHATYRDALTHAASYLGRADLDARHRAAGLEVQAIIQLALRDEAGARATLADLYARDPGHRLEDPDASPVVQSAFARAREGATPITVSLTDHTEAAPSARGTPEVSVALGEHADAVQELRVSYRRAGDARWLATNVATEGAAAASTPIAVSAPGEAAYDVEYRVEALSPSGAVIGQLGATDAPLHIAMPAVEHVAEALPDDQPVVASGGGVETEAWFWVVIGVLVVGAGVGIGVGVSVATAPTATNGSLDTITLPLISF